MAELIYYGGKLFWTLAMPGHVLFAWLAAGTWLLFSRLEYRRKRGRGMVMIGVAAGLIIATIPAGLWGMTMLENRFPQPQLPPQITGIIVIGGNEDEAVAASRGLLWTGFGTMGRELAFKFLAERYPDATLVYSGGSSYVDSPYPMRQADIAEVVLKAMGLQRPVMLEARSRTTYENALFSATMVGSDKIKQPWILVTSAWHMPRAAGTFRKLGSSMIPMPVGYTTASALPWFRLDFTMNMNALHGFMRETLGMIYYWCAGRSDAIFPGP